jgi:hypothetical protein
VRPVSPGMCMPPVALQLCIAASAVKESWQC